MRLLATPCVSDSATLTAENELASMPGSNTQTTQPRSVWRTSDNTSTNLVYDLGSSEALNIFAVMYHNADASALWRVRTATSEANLTSSPTHDSGTLSMRSAADSDVYTRFHSVYATSQTNRWVRLDFTSMSGMSYLQVGRVVMGNALDLAPRYEFTIQPREQVQLVQTLGALYANSGRQYRVLNFIYPGMTGTQAYATAGEIDRVCGGSSPCVAIIDETDSNRQIDWTFYGFLSNLSSTYHYTDVIERQYELQELERP